jgi:hypothetical protein
MYKFDDRRGRKLAFWFIRTCNCINLITRNDSCLTRDCERVFKVPWMKFYIVLSCNDCIERGLSWKANSLSAGQDISRLFWNVKVYFCLRSSAPALPVTSHINPVHPPTTYVYIFKIHFNIIFLSTCRYSARYLLFRLSD